jgi:nucleoside-diphosphate-sugar epimerase
MVLVTGASGAMGSVLVRMLHEKGEKIRACVLPDDPCVHRIADICYDIRYADLSDKSGIKDVCKDIKTVYHLAAVIISPDDSIFDRVNVIGTRYMAEDAVACGVAHFIYVSSASVVYPEPTPYSLSKRNAEEIVKKSGLHYTIIRPTLVYGKTGGQEFDMYLSYLERFPVIPFIGNGKSIKRPVFVDDVTNGLVALNGNTLTYGKVYDFCGDEPISMIDFSRLCMKLAGIQHKPVIHLPVWLCRFIALVMKIFMHNPPLKWQVIAGIIQDANLDPETAKKDLGYNPAKVSECLPDCFPRKNREGG